MGHCDNPECPTPGPLALWETNEVIIVVNGQTTAVRRYCNGCLAAAMGGLRDHLPAPQPVIEVTAKGETVVIGPDELARRQAAGTIP